MQTLQNARGLDSEDIGAFVKDISDLSGFFFRPQYMRRMFGNRLWMQGVGIETIAMLIRHGNPGVTFGCYIEVTVDILSAAMDKLVPVTMSQSKH